MIVATVLLLLRSFIVRFLLRSKRWIVLVKADQH